MNEIQAKLLEMMKWLHNFISENGLKYYICGGTMLGAARHKGFIPWDDDIDIFMPRDDYEKLCELLKEKKEHYIIETPNSNNQDYVYPYAKFYDTNTSMVEMLKKPIKRGLFIDVFPLDGLGDTMKEAKAYYKRIDRKNMFLASRVCAIRKNRKWYKNLAILLCRMVPSFLINEHRLCIKIDNLNKKRKYTDYQYVGLNVSTYRSRAIYNKDLFGKPTEYCFEDTVFWGPEHYKEYLTETYGNWTIIPSKEKQVSQHDFLDLDLNKSYLNS